MKQKKLNVCVKSEKEFLCVHFENGGINMRKNVMKLAAVMALAAVIAGSSSSVAFAHHGRTYRVVTQNPTPVCYADGSCDVDGVCTLGVDCDGTVHHTETYYYSGTSHHSRHHH